MGEPTPLRNLLLELARKGRFTVDLKDPALWKLWDEVVGEAIAHNARPHSLRRGTLWVVCSSPAWATQLQMMKEQLKERLNRHLGEGRVRDLRFFTGELKDREARPPSVEVPPEEAASVLAPLKDEDLRRHALRILKGMRAAKGRPR